jgi:GntR family transcriptional repressor for pyruvate dehydrogenase complex
VKTQQHDTCAEPHDVFRKVKGHHTQHAVIDQITFAIRTGVYVPGDRLPSLDELSRLLGVSRSVVIEAVRSLSLAGVIATQRGNGGGLKVQTANIPVALLGLSNDMFDQLPDILEARSAVEIRLALLCAERATSNDYENMETSVRRLIENRRADRLERRYWDHLFHYQMARAARSEMLAYFQHQILEQLTVVGESCFTRKENPREVEALHRETLDTLVAGDAQAIREVIGRHLAPLERLIEKSDPARPRSRK